MICNKSVQMNLLVAVVLCTKLSWFATKKISLVPTSVHIPFVTKLYFYGLSVMRSHSFSFIYLSFETVFKLPIIAVEYFYKCQMKAIFEPKSLISRASIDGVLSRNCFLKCISYERLCAQNLLQVIPLFRLKACDLFRFLVYYRHILLR